MVVDTIVKSATTKAFPGADVEAKKLRDLLLDAVTTDAQLKGIAFPADKPGKYAASIRLDSLGVVDLLCLRVSNPRSDSKAQGQSGQSRRIQINQ